MAGLRWEICRQCKYSKEISFSIMDFGVKYWLCYIWEECFGECGERDSEEMPIFFGTQAC